MRSLSLLLVPLASHAQVEDLDLSTPPVPMVAALPGDANNLTLGIPRSWFCDYQNYCRNGYTCCPWQDHIRWSCATNDRFATCPFAPARWNYYCSHNNPIICKHSCCNSASECIKGKCRRIRSDVVSSTDADDQLRVVAASQNQLDIRPPVRFTGALYDFADNLHGTILSHIAARNRRIGVQQCWVVGYPKDMYTCNPHQVTKACFEKDASLTLLDKKITMHNPNPPIQPAALQEAHWCNDSGETNSLQFTYAKTYTTSNTVTLTKTVSKEAGVSFEVGAEFEVITMKGTIHASISFSTSTQRSQTTTIQQSVSSVETINIPPHSRTTATCWVNEGTVSSPFTMRIGLSGYVAWVCSMYSSYASYAVPTERLWSIDGLRQGCASSWGMSAEQAGEVWNKTITGTFTAVHGYDVECTTRSVPIKQGEHCKSPHANEIVA
eukprot:GEMP01018881.1.p1 GENE.GEMP01018881.1~~GEMP01018881.1.p1  ORF type:complete len:450 (-),score=58.12 GEMP01018881.1:1370-2683(-)